jgi:membrane peptidoglycan carboxypeptidase
MLYQTAPVDKMSKLYPHLTIVKGRIAKVDWKKSPPAGWLRLKQMPRYTYMSIVIREDWAFYEHFGIDVRQLTLTLQESIEEGRFTRGASTISQQLVKNLFLTQSLSGIFFSLSLNLIVNIKTLQPELNLFFLRINRL